MASAWGYSFGKAFGNAFGLISAGDGGGIKRHRGNYFKPWRKVEKLLYKSPDRIDNKYVVVLAGAEHNPKTTDVSTLIREAALKPTVGFTEMQRQDEKLSRKFGIKDGGEVIEVPIFRPLLSQMPDFKTSTPEDFRSYAKHVRKELQEERRRIVLLLLNS